MSRGTGWTATGDFGARRRRQAALIRALTARRKRMSDLAGGDLIQEAVAAGRRAVALAPDEPEAHLALADALLAVWPRRGRARSMAFAEMDKAELLGADARDLAERRDTAESEADAVPLFVSCPGGPGDLDRRGSLAPTRDGDQGLAPQEGGAVARHS